MILEIPVLLGIQRLQQRRSGIAAHVVGDLVDLVQQKHGIHAPAALNGRDDAAGHRAHIGLAMAADLRLVVHAAQRHLGKLPVQRPGDGLCDGGLAHAGRADQADDGALELFRILAHGQVLQKAILDLLQAVVILLQHLAGAGQIDLRLLLHAPGQLQHVLDVVLADAGLRGLRGGAGKAANLALHLVAGLVGHLALLELLAVGGDLLVLILTQLVLNGVNLLP